MRFSLKNTTIKILLISYLAVFTSCNNLDSEKSELNGVNLVVLGNVQDAGSPQISCYKKCCKPLWNQPNEDRKVVSLGLIDFLNKKQYLFDASPDLKEQWAYLNQISGINSSQADGIFLTHAHSGHYTGLLDLGREALNAECCPVYAMPRMAQFLANNGPWDQLLELNQIEIRSIKNKKSININSNISVKPIKVPHRDEYSETVGFIIKGPKKTALYIPDINKWSIWEEPITDYIKKVDFAFLDATFYAANELPGRNMEEIPHPFVLESIALFEKLNKSEKEKIHFIHFNHTNPLLNKDSKEYQKVLNLGFNIAEFGDIFSL